LAVYVALQPPRVGPEQIAALDQRLTGIETKLAAATPREIGALDERLARIEGATQGLAETPSKIAAFGDRLAGIESRLNAVAPAPSHVAVLLDKDRRPMMNADLDVADGRLVLRLNIKPPRGFHRQDARGLAGATGRHAALPRVVPEQEERHDDGSAPIA
jgi:prophage DNA circulation protein